MKIKDLKRWPKLYAAAMEKADWGIWFNEGTPVIMLNKVGTPDDKEFWTAVAFGYIDQAKGIYGDLFTEVDVFQTISDIFGGWTPVAVEDSSFIDGLGLDSLDENDIAMQIEEEFDIELQDYDLNGLGFISDLVQLVEGKLAEKKVVEGFMKVDKPDVREVPDTNQHFHSRGDTLESFVVFVREGCSGDIFTLKEYELDKFKRGTREQLNVLASKDMIDGYLLAKFDKLLKEV